VNHSPMKNLFALLLLFLVTIALLPNASAQTPKENTIQILDFHSTHRCMTCNAIEKQTREVLNKHFSKELASGKITFQTMNVDEKSNSTLAQEFEASGTALFINVIQKGKSEKINLTQFAFMNANKKDDSFEKGIVEEVKKALAKIG
jgi:hypothetical protein